MKNYNWEFILQQRSNALFPSPELNLPQRIRRRIIIAMNDCWVWTGAVGGRTNKYPVLKYKNKRYHVIKFLFLHFNFPVNLPGLFKNKCGEKLCVNPWHLWSSQLSSTCFRGHSRNKATSLVKKNHSKVCRICVSEKDKNAS